MEIWHHLLDCFDPTLSPHPRADFKTLFSTSSQRSSTPRSALSKSRGFPLKTASLSYSVASGIVSGKSFTRLSNFSKKLSVAGVGWALVSRAMPFSSVDTVGMSAAVKANVLPCNDVDGVIDKGTGTGHCREKNENKVGSFCFFLLLMTLCLRF